MKALNEIFEKVPTFEEIAAIKPSNPGALPQRAATQLANSPAMLQWMDLSRQQGEKDDFMHRQASLQHTLKNLASSTEIPHAELQGIAAQVGPEVFNLSGGDTPDYRSVADPEEEALALQERARGAVYQEPFEDHRPAVPAFYPPYAPWRVANAQLDQHLQAYERHVQRTEQEQTRAQLDGLELLVAEMNRNAQAAQNYGRFLEDQVPTHHITVNQHNLVQMPVPVNRDLTRDMHQLARLGRDRQIPIEDLIQFYEQGGPQGMMMLEDAARLPVPEDDEDLAPLSGLPGRLEDERPLSQLAGQRAPHEWDGAGEHFFKRQPVAAIREYIRAAFGEEPPDRDPMTGRRLTKDGLVRFIVQRRGF